MGFIEVIKVIFYGIVEGITEWLPVSSTGHLILFESIWPMEQSEAFMSLFRVVIQLGAILAVIVLYFPRINPWDPRKSPEQKQGTWRLWAKILIGVAPAGVVGVLLNDFVDAHLSVWPVVAAALVLYGVGFILVEKRNADREPEVTTLAQLSYKKALQIGLIQLLSIIPGTSRSGSSILGATLLGVSRPVATVFSFLMAIPIMAGYSLLKLVKYLAAGLSLSAAEIVTLLLGMAVAFGVSLIAIRGLIRYIRSHSFRNFGIYRIVLGVIVIAYNLP